MKKQEKGEKQRDDVDHYGSKKYTANDKNRSAV